MAIGEGLVNGDDVTTRGGALPGGRKEGDSTIMLGICAWPGCVLGEPVGPRDALALGARPGCREEEVGTAIGVPGPGEVSLGDDRSIVDTGVSRAEEGWPGLDSS